MDYLPPKAQHLQNKPVDHFEDTAKPRKSLAYPKEREEYFKKCSFRHSSGPFFHLIVDLIRSVRRVNPSSRDGESFDINSNDPKTAITIMGARMEQLNDLLRATTEEVKESKQVLESLSNDVCALADTIGPMLLRQIKELRESRMAIVREVHEALAALRDIRNFFLEANYTTEMERLERLVRVCREIQNLKSEGVFDAVCDTALRMAVREESNHER